MIKKFKSLLVVGLILVFTLGMFTGCGGKKTETPAPEAPKAEEQKPASKNLTMYTSFPDSEFPAYIAEFEKATGIKVNVVRLSAGEVLTKLQAEKNNPQSSVWYGGPNDTFIAAAKEGLLEKYVSPELSNIPDNFKDKDEFWSPVYVGAIGFAVNKDWFQKKNLKYPESWEDLLKPEFKGQISMAHPSSSGTSYTILSTLIQMMGENEAIEYLKKLNTNVRQYTKSGSAPPQQAALGEAAIGIAFSHDCLKPSAEGYPIEVSFPKDGTGYEIGAVALIKGGPAEEVDNAKKFVDWSLTKEAQELYEGTKSFRLPVNKNAAPPAGSIKLEGIEVIDYDFQWAGDNRKRVVEDFTNKVSNADNLKK
jgi:iron(III) transport system substrate-binding protein